VIIHVNSNTIRSNRKHGTNRPPLSVRLSRSAKGMPAHEVAIYGADGELAATVVYRPDAPLPCGAQVWIEVPATGSVALWAEAEKEADA
jgi:hypothetical protein